MVEVAGMTVDQADRICSKVSPLWMSDDDGLVTSGGHTTDQLSVQAATNVANDVLKVVLYPLQFAEHRLSCTIQQCIAIVNLQADNASSHGLGNV